MASEPGGRHGAPGGGRRAARRAARAVGVADPAQPPAIAGAQRHVRPSMADLWFAPWCRPVDAIVAMALFLVIVASDGVQFRVARALAMQVTVEDAVLLVCVGIVWPLALAMAGVYDPRRVRTLPALAGSVVAGSAIGSALIALVPTRGVLAHRLGTNGAIALWVGTVAATLALRFAVRASRAIRRARATPLRVVIAGTGPRAARVWDELRHDPIDRYELVAITDTLDATPSGPLAAAPFVPVTELESFCMRTVVDEVVIALPVRSRYEEIEQVLQVCEHAGVHSLYLADAFAPTIARPRVSKSGSLAVVAMHVVHDDWRLAAKRLFDLVAATAALIALSPLLLAIALAVKLTSRGPVFFAQERYGLRKRRFRMYKFRTMVPDAERLQDALEDQNEAGGPVFKIKKDPRVTRVGALLRRTSLDELPQLWNIVKGDMAIVGPRPLPVRDVSRFDEPWLMRRFSVRPGLTCLWQISGRSNIGFDEWVSLDLDYIDRWSLRMDLGILVKTVPAVLRGTGAS